MAVDIWFDNECVNKKYDCWLKTYKIEPPEVRTITEELDGLDGIIDATEWLGRPIYGNRDGDFEFLFLPDGGWANVIKRVLAFRDKYHGKTATIHTDDDIFSYYSGRLTFGTVSNVKGSAQFTVSADLEPFRYKDVKTTYTIDDIKADGRQINNYWYLYVYVNVDAKSVDVTFTASGCDYRVYRVGLGEYTTIAAGESVTLTVPMKYDGQVELLPGDDSVDSSITLTYTEAHL